MEIFVSAVEASSDTHCAHLIEEMKAANLDISTFGLGGNELAKTGTELLIHNREFAGGGGPLEMIGQILPRRRLKERLRSRLQQKRPDGAILVDAGEINLKLAPVLHYFQIPTVYFIPPKVWVWRSSRLATIAKNVDLVLSILPFENRIYERLNIPFQYVGNPLLDEVPLKLTQTEAKAKLQINPQQTVLTVLPGSRHNEIRLQLDFFAECVKVFMGKLSESDPRPLILIPAAPIIEPTPIAEAFCSRLPGVAVKVVKGQSHACIKSARAAFIKSGTSTLEAALLQVPMVLAYHSSRSAEWVYRHIVRYRGFVGLVNLFLEPNSDAALGIGNEKPEPVVPEMILDRCKPELIAEQLIEVYREGPAREKMLKAFSRTPALLLPPPQLGKSPIQAAANAAWDVFERRSYRH
jgi:lipid-A-disaccharide synthase